MLFTMVWTALLMGLVGGTHCLAMCSAPCGALVGVGGQTACSSDAASSVQVVRWAPRQVQVRRAIAFHGGRVVGYAAAGALAALAIDSLAWLTQQTTALRPVWTLMHVAVMAWGFMLMVQSHQPAWLEAAGRAVWRRVRPWVGAPGGVLAAGVLWALMPCGLLYSALLVAALSGGALQGALTMSAFAVGSGLWLVGGPWAWARLRRGLKGASTEWGARIAGGLLCGVAAWALWMDLIYKPSLWCR
ncbi:MAG: sulfite exporter TauE/SafE family protein [Burkholderiaceae bacterium]|nr:sulfite exporter TauE/SafE family protein [Burkholderiaceae bacterium]